MHYYLTIHYSCNKISLFILLLRRIYHSQNFLELLTVNLVFSWVCFYESRLWPNWNWLKLLSCYRSITRTEMPNYTHYLRMSLAELAKLKRHASSCPSYRKFGCRDISVSNLSNLAYKKLDVCFSISWLYFQGVFTLGSLSRYYLDIPYVISR